MVQWLRIAVFLLAMAYLWIYPSMLLVPDEYREGFWSLNYNIPRKGLVVSREAYEIEAMFNSHTVYRVGVLTNGELHHFWVANPAVGRNLIDKELVKFETRGDVIVLAEAISQARLIISTLN